MTTVRRIPIADVELSVVCTNRCRAQFGKGVTLDVVAAKTDDERKAAGFRRRDIKDIREAASRPEAADESVLPPPHWTPADRYDRHPKRPEDWDWRNDPGMPDRFETAVRRLNFAADFADPRAPDQMTVVLRRDLLDLKHSWLRLSAWFDLTVSRTAEIAGLRRQRDELHETTNRYLERARTAEAAAAKAFTAGWNAHETGYSSDPDGCARAFGAFCINPETFTVEDEDEAEQPCIICNGSGRRTGPYRECGACNGSGRQ